ncbi:hypothetical protein GS894_02830 [Rhodococcus hoagii]|nr:hypothetical protein [Prescottella equi]NKR90358.1 hypothetical protein [Prescottella equi]NKS06761.1 hypothetical protein [Prescottella equi]NKT07351.1 hypothetical protein [Prescottella equi]NKT11973.1 hypothetical protein [Prescottella equi]
MRRQTASIVLWSLVVLGVMGAIGCINNTTYMAAALWAIIGLAAAGGLARRRIRAVQAERDRVAAIAARADNQNSAYLGGDPSGVYGEFRP